MNAAIHYWQFNRLDGSGKIVVEEIRTAKSFIDKQLPHLVNQAAFSDSVMQRYLFTLLSDNNSTVCLMAETCLRCFISEQIKQVCWSLERQFGNNHQFSCYDLYPFVLDDTLTYGKPPKTAAPATEYISMATKILQSFDPQQASLTTWTTRLVRHEPNLNHFLLERGIYLVSDWAILNDTTPKQLQRIFKEFHHLNDTVIAQAIRFLEAYHRIYRQERLANRKAKVRGKCPSPSLEQLQKIASLVELPLSPEKTLGQLQYLAERLREYRICVRVGKLKQDSLDIPDILTKVEQQQVAGIDGESAEEEVQEEFLSRYRQQFLTCLEQAIAQVISKWLSQQKEPKKQQFLTSLKLFHCQGYSMTKIAALIGLQAQYQVTRLMQLKNFRADIRQQMLKNLRHQVTEMAAVYTNPDQLRQQEQQIQTALDEQVSFFIEQAETEASTAKNRPLKSLFAQSLCHYLYLREKSL